MTRNGLRVSVDNVRLQVVTTSKCNQRPAGAMVYTVRQWLCLLLLATALASGLAFAEPSPGALGPSSPAMGDGNVWPSLTQTIGSPPTELGVTITSPTTDPDCWTNSQTFSISGDATGNVVSVQWSSSSGGSGLCDGTTSWSAGGILLSPGENAITVTVTDILGDTATAMLWAYCDLNPPSVSITSPTTNSTYTTQQSTVSLSGSGSDNVGVSVVTWSNNRGGSGTCTGTDNWSLDSVPLQLGDNIITVTAYDAAGNSGNASLTVTFVDTTPPTISFADPTSGSPYTTNSSQVDIDGTASDNIGVASVTWSNDRGGSGVCAGTTSWAKTHIPLALGQNDITVTALDPAGNTSAATITVIFVDITSPVVTITNPTSAPTYTVAAASLTVSGTFFGQCRSYQRGHGQVIVGAVGRVRARHHGRRVVSRWSLEPMLSPSPRATLPATLERVPSLSPCPTRRLRASL